MYSLNVILFHRFFKACQGKAAMSLSKEIYQLEPTTIEITTAKRRRTRRIRLRAAKEFSKLQNNTCHSVVKNKSSQINKHTSTNPDLVPPKPRTDPDSNILNKNYPIGSVSHINFKNTVSETVDMSKELDKTRAEVLAVREAKKLAKQKAKIKTANSSESGAQQNKKQDKDDKKSPEKLVPNSAKKAPETPKIEKVKPAPKSSPKSKDEVDKAITYNENISADTAKTKELILAERAAKKAMKGKKKLNLSSGEVLDDLTVKDVVKTLKDIVTVAREVEEVTNKVIAIDLGKKPEESQKSKAELRAERRAKQEAQRAAKQLPQEKKVEVKTETPQETIKPKEERTVKAKVIEKLKSKNQIQKMNWFHHLHTENEKEALKKIAINSNLHPAVIKLGVQLASRVVTGSNARCIAFLDALKKMIRDYSLPAKTEFARGLESQLAASVEFLWSMRHPAASQTNALKHFRHHLTQLPNNVDEFDAKKRLQEEIDRYIREQIDMAGEAISIAVRNKISHGDNILTYGCSSLIERILCEAQRAGVSFRAVVVGERTRGGAREMLRRLAAAGLDCVYADLSALSCVMRETNKVLVGAASLLASGAVVAAAGTLQTALLARAHNVPLLVACETHKFSDAVHTDAVLYHETGDPEDLVDKTDENSPLKDWQSNPNLNLLNLTYDVTPPSLVTAVVTELAILPCTSAPVVLRFKLSEYGL